MGKARTILNHKICTLIFLNIYKMSNPKEMENAETVTEKREKVIAKVEIEGMSEIKELKELETTKELEELGIEKITHM